MGSRLGAAGNLNVWIKTVLSFFAPSVNILGEQPMFKSIKLESVRHRRSIVMLMGVVSIAIDALPFARTLWTAGTHNHVSVVGSRVAAT
jgi:hypothetical protein